MERDPLSQELEAQIAPLIEEEGAELVELNFTRLRRRSILRILADKKEGGISVGECARLNAKIGQYLDELGSISEGYLLEVSSPGLDRPLVTGKDFYRCLNKEVKVFLNEAVNGRLELDGIIINADEESVWFNTEGKDIRVPLAKINKAKQIIR